MGLWRCHHLSPLAVRHSTPVRELQPRPPRPRHQRATVVHHHMQKQKGRGQWGGTAQGGLTRASEIGDPENVTNATWRGWRHLKAALYPPLTPASAALHAPSEAILLIHDKEDRLDDGGKKTGPPRHNPVHQAHKEALHVP